MKPRLFCVGSGFWACEYKHIGAIGNSPSDAYARWVKCCKYFESGE